MKEQDQVRVRGPYRATEFTERLTVVTELESMQRKVPISRAWQGRTLTCKAL